jgi:hypothetical protein
MSDDTGVRRALVSAQYGWPVFPCMPGEKAGRDQARITVAPKAALAVPHRDGRWSRLTDTVLTSAVDRPQSSDCPAST